MLREPVRKLQHYGIRIAYPVGINPEALLLFADLDARSAFDRYTIYGTNGNPVLYIRVPKVETELNPSMRRTLAK